MKKNSTTYSILAMSMLVVLPVHGQNKPEPPQARPQTANAAPVATQEQAIQLINDLIRKNEQFLLRIASPEMGLQTAIWQQKGIIKFPPGMAWDTFKHDVQQFGVDLNTLLEQDEKGVYYHISNLRENHLLYQTLIRLNQAIAFQRYPKGSNGAPLIEKISSKAVGPIIRHYISFFYGQKFLEQLKTFFEKFEERAKTLRAQAEEAQKKAEQTRASEITEIDYSSPSYEEIPLDFTIQESEEERPAEYDESTIDWGF